MIQSGKEITNNFLFWFIYNYFQPFVYKFYNIKIINKENLFHDKPVIFISKHTSHNYDIIPGLLTFYKELKKPIRGLGHRLNYLICPYYNKLGVVVGNRENAEYLIKNNENIYIIPGGSEEMISSLSKPNVVNWISKSGKFKVGFAKLAMDCNIDIVPISAKNINYMVFSPVMYLVNKTNLIYKFDKLMDNSGKFYIILFYIKVLFTLIFASVLVIPIPVSITFLIGVPVKKYEDDTLLEYTERCENDLQNLIYRVNSI